MLMRWSSTFCNSSGQRKVFDHKGVRVSPYSVRPVQLFADFRQGPWFAAISKNGHLAGGKCIGHLATMVLRNWPSDPRQRYRSRVPLICCRTTFASLK